MDEKNVCLFCAEQTKDVCEFCSLPVCKPNHFKVHRSKSLCWPYRMRKGPFGRYIVATRDIEPLETVLIDECESFSPKLDSELVCLECWARTDKRCGNCGVPLCCKPRLHKIECKAFADSGKITEAELLKEKEILSAVGCYRILSGNYKELILNLMDNLEWIQQTKDFSKFTAVSDFMRKRKLLRNESEHTVHRILGILKSNSCNASNYNARGIFPVFALINHSCRNNVRHIVNSAERSIEVVTKVPVKRGEEINVRYTTDFLVPLNERKRFIWSAWNFNCQCQVCQDPTENESYLSAIKCLKCKSGYMLPKQVFLEYSGEQAELPVTFYWRCANCDNEMAEEKVEAVIKKVSTAFEKVQHNDLKKLESFLKVCQNIVHPNHALTLKVRRALLGLYLEGAQVSDLANNTTEKSREVIKFTEDYLSVLGLIDPGFTQYRSRLLYQSVKISMITILQDMKNGFSMKAVEDLTVCVSNLEEAMAGISGEDKYLHGEESLKTRVQILSTNPNLGEGYSMLLKLIKKLPLR